MMATDLLTPDGTAPIAVTALWIEQVLLGSIATTIAVIAVAAVGLLILSGRIDIRRGVTVVVGCFIVFGASTIVSGLQVAIENVGEPVDFEPRSFEPAMPAVVQPPPVTSASDPYAGASVPKTR